MLINNCIIFLSIIALYFFSFHPFVWISNSLHVSKPVLFLLILASAFFVLIVSFLKQKKIKVNKRIVLAGLGYILFSCYALGSHLVTNNILDDTYTIRTIVFVNSIFIILAINCRKNKLFYVKSLWILSSVYFIFFIFSFFYGRIHLSSYTFQSIFLDEFGSYQADNMYLGIFSLLNIILLSIVNSKLRKIIHLMLSIASFFAMLCVGGRASIVAILISSSIYLISIYKFRINFFVTVISFLIILMSIVMYYGDYFLHSVTVMRFMSLANLHNDSSGRLFLFSSAIKLFFRDESSFLFGAGINSFPVYIGYFTAGWYPHNIVLELLAEYGVVGFMFFCLPVLFILFMRRKFYKSFFGGPRIEKGIFTLFIYYFIIFSFTGGMRTSWTLLFYLFMLIPYPQKTILRKINLDSKSISQHA